MVPRRSTRSRSRARIRRRTSRTTSRCSVSSPSTPPDFGRVEIPVTYRHWETAFVAPQVALARGWERQLDYAYDDQFYDKTLTPASYREWLAANGVAYVALPDAQLDPSSTIEAGILESGQPYLKPVWHNAHWQVWQVAGYHGLVDGPAHLQSLTSDGFTLHVTEAGLGDGAHSRLTALGGRR